MKNKLTTLMGIILLCALTLFTCTGCKGTGAYAAKVNADESYTADVVGTADKGITALSIGHSALNAKWSKSVRYKTTDKLYDRYEVINSEDKSLTGTLEIDSNTGEVVSFSLINSFPPINNIGLLSDEELKTAAEQLLGGLADFSQYNVFEVTRPTHSGGYRDICLSWQVERDILCNIGVTVYVSEDGVINSFSKTDDCPDGTAESYIPRDERIKLLEAEICHYLGVKSIDGVNYEILTEKLSLSHNEPCVYYTVKITDEAGFPEIDLFGVYKR